MAERFASVSEDELCEKCIIKQLSMGIIKRRFNMAARGYEFYLRVLKVSLTSELSERVRDTFSTRR